MWASAAPLFSAHVPSKRGGISVREYPYPAADAEHGEIYTKSQESEINHQTSGIGGICCLRRQY